jgi:hypothetical protein
MSTFSAGYKTTETDAILREISDSLKTIAIQTKVAPKSFVTAIWATTLVALTLGALFVYYLSTLFGGVQNLLRIFKAS